MKPITLGWMDKIRELKEKYPDNQREVLNQLWNFGLKIEKELIEHFTKSLTGECNCDSCEYDRKVKKNGRIS